MPSTIECIECGYSRSSDQDGRSFTEVCSICYLEDCSTMISPLALICDECREELEPERLIDPGESLLM